MSMPETLYALTPEQSGERGWGEYELFKTEENTEYKQAPMWQPISDDKPGFDEAKPPYDGGVYLGYADGVTFTMVYNCKEDQWTGFIYGVFSRNLDGSFMHVNPTYWQERPTPPEESK